MERTETKQPCGATSVNVCLATEVEQKNATQFEQGQTTGRQEPCVNLATRGLEPVPVNVSAGCAKQKKTSKGNKVPVIRRKRTKGRLAQADSAPNAGDAQQQQHLGQRGHWCLHRVACCELTTGTGHYTPHTQRKVTGHKNRLQLQYFN